MKEKKIEQLSYKTVYVAADGTEFDDPNECAKYDKSAVGVLKGRVKEMAIKDADEEAIFNCGNSENRVLVCIPKNQEDIDTIKQLIFATGGDERYANKLDGCINKVVLVFFCYDDYIYIDTLNDVVFRTTNGKYKLEKLESPEEL